MISEKMEATGTGQLNSKWMKAAVLGCLWASSEIVLGSFLHNLRVPFSGNILTAIGLMLLISVSHLWKEPGLFWRSGLVCALMKTVSPSAVIFGPMIAIMSEALLLEFSTRIIGRNWIGFLLGGVLAMSWNLLHRIGNLIIIYGMNIVDLYENLTQYAQKQFHLQSDITWMPIFVLWVFYLIFGLGASAAGIYIGRKAVRTPLKGLGAKPGSGLLKPKGKTDQPFRWSILWLGFSLVAMVTLLFLINRSKWYLWLPAGFVLLLLWGFRYHRALRPLKKPRFWIFFVLITMLTSFLFVQLQDQPGGWMAGLMTGLQMNFRAAIMIVGFSAIGTELYNPVIRRFFEKTWFRQLPMALEVAFDTLPQAIASLPAAKEIFRNPVLVIHQLVAQAGYFLEKVNIRFQHKPFVVILSGRIGEGKTSMLNSVAALLKEKGITAGGILSPAVQENNQRVGYDLIRLTDGEQMVLSRISDQPGWVKVGKFTVFEEGFRFGVQALEPDNNQGSEVVLIDEIGPWELEGEGWAQSVNALLLADKPMVWVVRETLADQVVSEWNLTDYRILRISETTVYEVVDFIKGRHL